MRTRLPLLAAILAVAASSVATALDLTPQLSFRLLEDMKIPVVIFEDGPRKVQWQAPAKWSLNGGGELLSLRPPDSSKMGMELRLIPRKAAEAPDGTTARDAVQSWVQPFLPADASKIAFQREIPSPFMLGGKPSRELTFTYTSLFENFTASIALTDLDDEQSIAVIIYARDADFASIHTEGIKSMFRWIWLGPASPHARPGARGSGTSSTDYRPLE